MGALGSGHGEKVNPTKLAKRVFEKWDSNNHDCSGDFKQFYMDIGSPELSCSMDEVFSFADINGDGCISYIELKKAFKEVMGSCF